MLFSRPIVLTNQLVRLTAGYPRTSLVRERLQMNQASLVMAHPASWKAGANQRCGASSFLPGTINWALNMLASDSSITAFKLSSPQISWRISCDWMNRQAWSMSWQSLVQKRPLICAVKVLCDQPPWIGRRRDAHRTDQDPVPRNVPGNLRISRSRLLRSRKFSLCSLVTIEKVGESKPSNF